MADTIYHHDYETSAYPALSSDMHCRIAIIGGGLSGLSIAWQLADHVQDIALFEADTIACSNSGRNTGKITLQQGLIYDKMIRHLGLEAAKAYVQTQQQAFQEIRHIIETHVIDCDYEIKDSILYTTIPDEIEEYRREYDACRQLGLDVVITDHLDIDPKCKIALTLKNMAAYNPKKYCDALARILTQKHVTIYERTPIISYHKENEVIRLKTRDGRTVIADQVIIATSFPCFDDGNLFFLRLPNLRSYIVTGKSKAANLDYNDLDAYYLTTNLPTRSLRSYRGELMICGGDHRVGVTVPDPFRKLKEIGRLDYQISSFSYAWAAQDYLTHDSLPYCGYLSPNTNKMYVMTGYNQWGNINAMTCALVLKDLIQHKEHPLFRYVDAQRILPQLGVKFFQDNAEMIRQLILSKFQKKTTVPEKPETHAFIRINGKTYGAYMNERHQLYIVDILCPHAGCTLRFNEAEKTWDCPCHSSRFHYDGSILNGPATQPLHLFPDGFNTVDPHWFD